MKTDDSKLLDVRWPDVYGKTVLRSVPGVKPDKLKFLNVTDDRWPDSYMTIIYVGDLHPWREGFIYSFKYGTGKGWTVNGVGAVDSERYSKMSSEEIELTCSVENPPSREDIYKACIRGDMTPECASAYVKSII